MPTAAEAAAIITSRCMAGNDVGTLGISVVFFVLGQVTLHVFVSLFRALTTYDDAEQIAGENLAAALTDFTLRPLPEAAAELSPRPGRMGHRQPGERQRPRMGDQFVHDVLRGRLGVLQRHAA